VIETHLRLKTVQIGDGALCMGGSLEDRALVEPSLAEASTIRAMIKSDRRRRHSSGANCVGLQ
jgi:hypothetical protein